MTTAPPFERRDFLLLLASGLAAGAAWAAPAEPIVGLPCEGCDAVFAGMPATFASSARIAPAGQPGEALQVQGQVLDAQGRPAAGIVIYAYHTDASGHYPSAAALRGSSAEPHGRLRSWVRSDAQGRYRFDSIRPGGYPGRIDPQHIHLHVIEPGRCTYYIDDIHFSDDARLAPYRARHTAALRGGSGLAEPRRDRSGTWQVTRDIRLGLNIPGYASCALSP
ncbi:protocatechuate 3,4-dioxygenase beta subunit [Tahibacter aquaticus]|uniref:Protocatechuate 3,4-dioxygenase beta subunit n=1 Tax=Tahibacter aquaticus TaxID=520092 RepID=A0A4R6YQG1_9GAMM|nr:hypothetical protein [Tahibacter aquaticus]TDR39962.1 protocatechuate 3,4-dioxygenase beta subunit [Tahibacter aquaticus]